MLSTKFRMAALFAVAAGSIWLAGSAVSQEKQKSPATPDTDQPRSRSVSITAGCRASSYSAQAKAVAVVSCPASKIVINKVSEDPKIAVRYNTEVRALHGESKLNGITIRDRTTGAGV